MSSSGLPPIPPSRGVPTAAQGGGTSSEPQDEEKEIMCAQVADLVIQKERDRVEVERLRELIETYQQQLSGNPAILLPSPSKHKQRVASAGTHKRQDAAQTPLTQKALHNADVPAHAAPHDATLVVAQLQLLRLQSQNETLAASSAALQGECADLERVYQEKLEAARVGSENQEMRIAQLEKEKVMLTSRVANDILLQSQRNRIEMAARRISAPKVSRQAGLRRLEACERNSLAAHDDLFYLRRDLSMHVPTHRVTLVLQMFHGVGELETTSPGLVPYLLATYHATLASQASRRAGYHVSDWGSFSCYAFRSPSAAVAFASACHIELMYFDWPDAIVHCRPFAPEYAKAAVEQAPAAPNATPSGRRLGGDEDTKRGALVFQGPRIHSYLHYGNPCSEVDAKSGRLLFFGHEVNVAVSTLAYLVRPGEICANTEWGEALLAEAAPTPSTPPPPPTKDSASSPSVESPSLAETQRSPVLVAPSSRGSMFGFSDNPADQAMNSSGNGGKNVCALDVIKAHGYLSSDTRKGFPRISVVTQTEPVQRGAYSRSPPALPTWLLVPELFSVIPDALSARRKHCLPLKPESSWTASSLASTDAHMVFVLLANRCLNGRACGPGSITDEMRLWIAKAVRLSIAQAASTPVLPALQRNDHGSASSAAPASGRPLSSDPNAAPQGSVVSSIGAASPSRSHRRSVQSDVASQRHRAPSVHPQEATAAGDGAGQRRRTSRSAPSDALLAPGTGTTPQSTATTTAQLPSHAVSSHAALPPILSIPFPPLLDLAPRGSTSAATRLESKRYFSAYVFQRQAQAFELAAMEREDAFLATMHKPLSPLHPPTAFVTVDVVRLRTFDGSSDLAVTRFISPFKKMLQQVGDLHHAFLVASNGEDVHTFAFRSVDDALRFTSTAHLRFQKDGLLDYLFPSWVPPLALDPAPAAAMSSTPAMVFPTVVNLRCGVSYGIPSAVATRVSDNVLGDYEKRGLVPSRGAYTDCTGFIVCKSGYLCAAATPGETLATSHAIKAYYASSKKNLTSLELTIVQRGLRTIAGCSCPTTLYTVQNPALVRGSQVIGGSRSCRSFSQSIRSASVAVSSSAPSVPAAQTPQSSQQQPKDVVVPAGAAPSSPGWFTEVRGPVQVGGVLFDVATVASVVFSPPTQPTVGAAAVSPQQVPLIETVISADLDKIVNVVDAKRRGVFPLFETHAGHQRVLRRALAAMHRQQMAESILMSMHDPLAHDAACRVAPSTAKDLAILYTDIEGSAKLFEAAGEAFNRAQQHYNWLVRDLANQNDGYVTHTNGFEGWVIVFPTVKHALEVAIALQQLLLSVDWPSDIVKHERALRVRDPRSGGVLFNGLRARVGIAMGPLVQQSSGAGQRLDFVGGAVDDAVRLGRTAPGGDVWLTPGTLRALEALADHANPIVSGAHRRLLAQLKIRVVQQATAGVPPAADDSPPLAVSCVLRTMEGRFAKFPAIAVIHERHSRITSQMEKDLGTWWKQPVTLGIRNEAAKIQLVKKKSIVGAAFLSAANSNDGNRNPSMSSPPSVVMLLDRLQRLEQTLPPAANSTGASTPRQGKQPAPPMSTGGASVSNLTQVIRSIIGILRGGPEMAASIQLLEDASRSLGAPDGSPEVTPTTVSLKPVGPPPSNGRKGAPRGGRRQ